MKIAVFDGDRLGLVEGEEVVDITGTLDLRPGRGGPLLAFLDAGGTSADLAALDTTALPRRPLAGVRLEAPLRRPGKVVGAPVNYVDHQLEMDEQRTIAEYGVFLKAPSSVSGPGEAVRLPYTDRRTDHEGELGIVIGSFAADVGVAEALDHVLGYVPVLDITVRSTEDRSTRKSFRTFTPLGPWVTTAEEVGDADALELRCSVNGTLRQHASTADLIYSVAELVSYASHVMDLEPGDVIATGTPAGVGPLADGDELTLEIERLGRLTVPVTAAGAVPYARRPVPAGLTRTEG